MISPNRSIVELTEVTEEPSSDSMLVASPRWGKPQEEGCFPNNPNEWDGFWVMGTRVSYVYFEGEWCIWGDPKKENEIATILGL